MPLGYESIPCPMQPLSTQRASIQPLESIVHTRKHFQIKGLWTGLVLSAFHTLIVHHTISTTFSRHYGFALERALNLS
jgi:hypothetical protein